MKLVVDRLLQHYATVTTGESALFRDTLLQICEVHDVDEKTFCRLFALEVAQRFISGDLDADGASFAMDDLNDASGYALEGVAWNLFNALEDGSSSPVDVRDLLNRSAVGRPSSKP